LPRTTVRAVLIRLAMPVLPSLRVPVLPWAGLPRFRSACVPRSVRGITPIHVPAEFRGTSVRSLTRAVVTNAAPSIEPAGPGNGGDRRVAVVGMSHHRGIIPGSLHVLPLHCRRLDVLLPFRQALLGCWFRSDAGAAVVAHPGHIHVIDHGLVVDIVNDSHIDVRDAAVVCKRATNPAAAGIADTGIAETIMHTAIEADVRAPVSGVPDVRPADVAPISRRPQDANTRRSHPGPGHPVVPGGCPGPVTRSPDPSGHGAGRLHVNR